MEKAFKKTDRPEVGSSFPTTAVLTELDALLATFFAASSILAMYIQDFFALRAILVVVIYVPILRPIFQGVSVVRI